MRALKVGIAAALAGLLLAACGSGNGAPAVPDGATPGDTSSIPVEPFPEVLPEPFLFRNDDDLPPGEEETAEILYTVQPGDTLATIAAAYGVTAAQIQRLNGVADPSLLRAGDELRIPVPEGQRIAASTDAEAADDFSGPPPGEQYTVQSGDNLFDIGVQFGVAWEEIAAYNRLSEFEASHLSAGQILVIPPQDEEEAQEPPG